MYTDHYGLTGNPFQLTPDPRFWFESDTHRKAMAYLGYGLAQGEGFIVITGDIGAGKTTLVGHLMENVDSERLTAAEIVSTQVEGDDMLRLVAQRFGIESGGASKAELLDRIERFLHEQGRSGRRTLLIVDEAQNLGHSALEELRMLSNFQTGGRALLQIFLLGQPEFRDRVKKSPGLEQLRQRIIATHHLDPMKPEEIGDYVGHRMGLVGWDGHPEFSDGAFAAIHAATDGVPRRVNSLMARLLLYGAVEDLSVIDAGAVEAVVADLDADQGDAEAAPESALEAEVAPAKPEWPPRAVSDAEESPEPAFVAEAEAEEAPALAAFDEPARERMTCAMRCRSISRIGSRSALSRA
ncbi:MAG: XrtA-associated ATPase [Sphingomonadales bacterium]|nr:XrtA-associated ATPase [Sphingomonadales bacterium]